MREEDNDIVERAASALIAALPAPAKVILLEQADEFCQEHQFVVVGASVESRFAEIARLGALLGRMLIPADVAVLAEHEVRGGGLSGSTRARRSIISASRVGTSRLSRT